MRNRRRDRYLILDNALHRLLLPEGLFTHRFLGEPADILCAAEGQFPDSLAPYRGVLLGGSEAAVADFFAAAFFAVAFLALADFFAAVFFAVFFFAVFFLAFFFVVFLLVAFFFVVFFFAPSASPSAALPPRGWNSKPWRPFSLSTSVALNGRPKRDVKSVRSSVRPPFT